MSQDDKVTWVRLVSTLCIAALFVADYGLDVMAKTPPVWAYAIPGLLALGIEIGALRRLVIRALQTATGSTPNKDDKDV